MTADVACWPAQAREILAALPDEAAEAATGSLQRWLAAAGRLDDRLHRSDVIGRNAHRVDRNVHGSLGHQHVLPEVADPA